eukprot:scaffold13637_cov112-Isochrysis_galbana.AAC.3
MQCSVAPGSPGYRRRRMRRIDAADGIPSPWERAGPQAHTTAASPYYRGWVLVTGDAAYAGCGARYCCRCWRQCGSAGAQSVTGRLDQGCRVRYQSDV